MIEKSMGEIVRFQGKLKTWNEERAFGFIEPASGNQEIFVHITAFKNRTIRPKVGQQVTFEVELNSDGKKRAYAVESELTLTAGRNRPINRNAGQLGRGGYWAILFFLVIYLFIAKIWLIPNWVAWLYFGCSVVTFLVYAWDKSAAKSGSWRTSESTLITLGLIGGWPGAILAQQTLRHKSSKAAFLTLFWFTVILNIAVFIVATTPLLHYVTQK
jgi:uncharacterized membrane protein YsdA (DUF1294 family)/cold shock CspA family protein